MRVEAVGFGVSGFMGGPCGRPSWTWLPMAADPIADLIRSFGLQGRVEQVT